MLITSKRVRIWDLPTRIFHWALVIAVVGAFVCVKVGGLYMDWHIYFGCTALGLIVFRVLWGVFGTRYARFSTFVRGPRAVMDYVRGRSTYAGHNPLGAYSVVALLMVFGFQAVSGLFANDDILTQGPLASYVSSSTSATLTAWHSLNEWVMIVLVSLHVLAVAWYAIVRRQRIVRAMVTGDARSIDVPATTQAAEDNWRVWLKALILAGIVSAGVWWILSLQASGASSYM